VDCRRSYRVRFICPKPARSYCGFPAAAGEQSASPRTKLPTARSLLSLCPRAYVRGKGRLTRSELLNKAVEEYARHRRRSTSAYLTSGLAELYAKRPHSRRRDRGAGHHQESPNNLEARRCSEEIYLRSLATCRRAAAPRRLELRSSNMSRSCGCNPTAWTTTCFSASLPLNNDLQKAESEIQDRGEAAAGLRRSVTTLPISTMSWATRRARRCSVRCRERSALPSSIRHSVYTYEQQKQYKEPSRRIGTRLKWTATISTRFAARSEPAERWPG